VKIDNLVMIAHNCDIGSDSAIIAQTGIAGSTRLGPRAVLMAQAGVAGHLEIGSDLFLDVRGGVGRNQPDGARIGGRFPNLELRAGQRVRAALIRLPQALRRIRALERRLGIGVRKPEPDAEDEA
jgi:UDP-3-O-[3-hydroxymyristoyl] glucosamine N-acyltransferase